MEFVCWKGMRRVTETLLLRRMEAISQGSANFVTETLLSALSSRQHSLNTCAVTIFIYFLLYAWTDISVRALVAFLPAFSAYISLKVYHHLKYPCAVCKSDTGALFTPWLNLK